MATLIVLLIILVLALIILPFARDLMKDKEDLRKSPIEVRFKVLIEEINKAFLDGKGTTAYPEKNDNRWLNLHSVDKANYLFQFNYSTGHLTVYLHYKYLQKEFTSKDVFYNVRDVDIFAQKRMANEFIQKMRAAIVKHQESIGIPKTSGAAISHSEFDENDPVDLVGSLYQNMSLRQKKSVINMGYLIFSANGASWEDYIKNVTTRQQLNFLDLNWKDCRSQLESEGENAIYTDLKTLDGGTYDSLLMYWMSLVVTDHGPDEARSEKFFLMNGALGHSESDVEQRIQKIQAFMQIFG